MEHVHACMHACIWGDILIITYTDDCHMQIPGFNHLQSLGTCDWLTHVQNTLESSVSIMFSGATVIVNML